MRQCRRNRDATVLLAASGTVARSCPSATGTTGQYTSIRFTEHLELEEITPSIGTVGDVYDNAT